MSINWIDWFGYLASVVILVSLTMSSIVKLRWINLFGGAMFSTFGFMIGSLPTGLLNLGIVFIDIYYLYIIYTKKEDFAMVEAELDSRYFKHFMDSNIEEIKEYYDISEDKDKVAYYFLRNNNIAGVLVGKAVSTEAFYIEMDYVTKEYRDFKIARHFLEKNKTSLLLKGYKELHARAKTKDHAEYLEKMGFVKKQENEYVKTI